MNEHRARIWFALFVLVVFCAGLGAGVALDRTLGRPWRGPGGPRAGMPGPPGGAGRFAERLAADLQLTADQRQQLDRLLEARRERLDRFHEEVQQRVGAEQRDLRDAIRAILTPEQQARFDDWIKRSPLPPGLPPPGAPGPQGRPGDRPRPPA